MAEIHLMHHQQFVGEGNELINVAFVDVTACMMMKNSPVLAN